MSITNLNSLYRQSIPNITAPNIDHNTTTSSVLGRNTTKLLSPSYSNEEYKYKTYQSSPTIHLKDNFSYYNRNN